MAGIHEDSDIDDGLVERGIGVICSAEEKVLVGNAISALRRLGGKAQTSRALQVLVSNYGLTDGASRFALFHLLETKQVVKNADIWELDEAVIEKYGYPEHKIQRRVAEKPVKKKISMLRRAEKSQPAKVDPVISVQDDIKILKQILTGQPNSTMIKGLCKTALRSRGVGQQRLDRLFREIEKEGLVIYGRLEDDTPTITWAESTSNHEMPEDYSVIKRFSG